MSPFDGILVGVHMLAVHLDIDQRRPGRSCNYYADGSNSCVEDPWRGLPESTLQPVQATPGLYAMAPSGLTGGFYRNSYGRLSLYAGWTLQTEDERWAVTVGAVTGYTRKLAKATLVPSYAHDIGEGRRIRFSVIPQVHDAGAWMFGASIEWKL